jgi:YfiH family protein
MFVTAPALSALPGIRHAFFTRQGGVSSGVYDSLNTGLGSHDDPAAVAENRARIAAVMGVEPDRLVTLYQVHSADVVTVTAPFADQENRPRADALVTATPGLAIATSSADCGPILLADAEARVIGAAHAGWRGALAGVAEATVEAMERIGARRSHIVAAVGPMISRAAFEVGPEVRAAFLARHPDAERFFSPSQREGRLMLDLPAFIVWRLAEAGAGKVADLGLCTYSNEALFYSYRRTTHRAEADYGRHLSAIVLG